MKPRSFAADAVVVVAPCGCNEGRPVGSLDVAAIAGSLVDVADRVARGTAVAGATR